MQKTYLIVNKQVKFLTSQYVGLVKVPIQRPMP